MDHCRLCPRRQAPARPLLIAAHEGRRLWQLSEAVWRLVPRAASARAPARPGPRRRRGLTATTADVPRRQHRAIRSSESVHCHSPSPEVLKGRIVQHCNGLLPSLHARMHLRCASFACTKDTLVAWVPNRAQSYNTWASSPHRAPSNAIQESFRSKGSMEDSRHSPSTWPSTQADRPAKSSHVCLAHRFSERARQVLLGEDLACRQQLLVHQLLQRQHPHLDDLRPTWPTTACHFAGLESGSSRAGITDKLVQPRAEGQALNSSPTQGISSASHLESAGEDCPRSILHHNDTQHQRYT